MNGTIRDAIHSAEAADHDIRAWVFLNPSAAKAGRRGGRLAGVRFGVKDLIDVAGMPTALGLAADEYRPPIARRSAAAVERLEAEGAIAVGKTVTSALGFDRPGPTRNPLDLSRSPGASSSGSAAAVAAGLVPLALGSQAVGSVIRPASYCGIWAFVPSHGVVPSAGSLVLSESLDRIGIFASSPGGLALAARALVGDDSEPAEAPNTRIGVLAGGELASRALESARHLARLLSDLPHLAKPLDAQIYFSAILDAARTIAAYEFHRNLAKKPALASLNKALIEKLAPAVPSEQSYRGALAFRGRFAEEWEQMTTDFDAVVLQSAVAEAPSGFLDAQDPAPAALGSLLGLPAVNIPLFSSQNGLPLGCQMLGRKGNDIATLSLAARLASDANSRKY